MSIGGAPNKSTFQLQLGVPRRSQVPQSTQIPTGGPNPRGPLNACAPNLPIIKELTRSPDGCFSFAGVVEGVAGLSVYSQPLAVGAFAAATVVFIGPTIGATAAAVTAAKLLLGATSFVSGTIGGSVQLQNYYEGEEVDPLKLAGSICQVAGGTALLAKDWPALAAAFAGSTTVNTAKAAQDPSLPNVAVAILGVGGLASHEVGYAQLTDGLSCLQSAFALVNTGNQGGKIEPVNTQVTQTRRSQQARAIPESLNRLSQTLAALQQIQNLPEADKLLFDILKTLPEITANAKKDIGALIDQNPRYNDLQKLIELESAKASAVIAAATGLENVSSSEQINTKPLEFTGKGPKIEAKIKKLSVRKKILFAVGAVLGLACCAVLIAGTFGAAAIPLAILGGVAGTSILSGVGVQLAQKKLENSNDAVAPKLADLQKSNLYTLEKWREDNGIKAIMDIFQEIDASQKLGPDFNSWRLPR